MQDIAYSRDTVEFVTVAAEFCAYLEQSEGREPVAFRNTLLKLLPLLYLKASLLPRVEGNDLCQPDEAVTEQDYEWIRSVARDVMGADDEYVDTLPVDAMQTDEVRVCSVAENLADIYQPVRNFLSTYSHGVEENIGEALWGLTEAFELYWGERVVDTLRMLHRLHYGALHTDDDE